MTAISPPGGVRPLVAVLDYGIGNVHSAQKALERGGADAQLTADPESSVTLMAWCCPV